MKIQNQTTQDWTEIEYIYENGIIKLKDSTYVRIIKISPINFNLKSELEKRSILNSYKIFLKTCNFNLQIVIQSNKEDLEKNIKLIKNNIEKENKKFLEEISNEYIEYINSINSLKTSATKEFYIVISNRKTTENNGDEIVFEELNDMFLKIKECLQRCGNSVKNLNNKKEVEKILYSFYNTRIFFLNKT